MYDISLSLMVLLCPASSLVKNVVVCVCVGAWKPLQQGYSLIDENWSFPHLAGINQCIVGSLSPKSCLKTIKCFTSNTFMLPLGIGLGLGSLLVIALLFFYRRHQIQKKKQASGKRFTNLINFLLFYHRISPNFNRSTSGTRKDDLDEGFHVLI